jgi:hypothetical protein
MEPGAIAYAVTAVYMLCWVPFGLAALLMFPFIRIMLDKPEAVLSRTSRAFRVTCPARRLTTGRLRGRARTRTAPSGADGTGAIEWRPVIGSTCARDEADMPHPGLATDLPVAAPAALAQSPSGKRSTSEIPARRSGTRKALPPTAIRGSVAGFGLHPVNRVLDHRQGAVEHRVGQGGRHFGERLIADLGDAGGSGESSELSTMWTTRRESAGPGCSRPALQQGDPRSARNPHRGAAELA